MYWLQRPPYLRWAAAALLIVGAGWWDLRSSATTQYPFAATEILQGTELDAQAIEWRSVRGFPEPPDPRGVAAVDIPAGQPLTAAVLGSHVVVPDGWWIVPLDVPGALPGDEVLVVITDPQLSVPGMVVALQRGDRFSLDHRPATVAVPGDMAPVVAAASQAGYVVTVVKPS